MSSHSYFLNREGMKIAISDISLKEWDISSSNVASSIYMPSKDKAISATGLGGP
jgi:hypothetical protein